MVEKSDLTSTVPDWWSHIYGPVRQFGERVAEFFSPSSEAATTAEHYEISLELPGVSDSDISIEIHDGRLNVTGEKRSTHKEEGKDYYFSERVYGAFRRSFRLPSDADPDNVSATNKDGVLTINVAKLTPKSPAPKKVRITRT